MIKYNWDKIKQRVSGKPDRVIAIMYLLSKGTLPKKYSKCLMGIDLKGLGGCSYLLNPAKLLKERHLYSEAEVMMYIHLASLRDFTSYHFEGKKGLPLSHADIHEKYIKHNGLLEIVGNTIQFKYEE